MNGQIQRMQRSRIFLRVDDLGCDDLPTIPQIISICLRENIPVILAIIPEKLGSETADYLKSLIQQPHQGVILAQHGVSHTPCSGIGKKMEFSLWESRDHISGKLAYGRAILQKYLGIQVHWYVPPWNKYGRNLIRALEALEFRAFSASTRLPFSSKIMASFPVNQDVVTYGARKETDPNPDTWVSESERILSQQERCGLMLHHHWLEQRHIRALDVWAKRVSSFNRNMD